MDSKPIDISASFNIRNAERGVEVVELELGSHDCVQSR